MAKRDIGEEGYRRRGILLGAHKGARGRERQALCLPGMRHDQARASSRGAPQRAVGARARGVVWPDVGLLDCVSAFEAGGGGSSRHLYVESCKIMLVLVEP